MSHCEARLNRTLFQSFIVTRKKIEMEKYILTIKHIGSLTHVEGDKLWPAKVTVYHEFCHFNINSSFSNLDSALQI